MNNNDGHENKKSRSFIIKAYAKNLFAYITRGNFISNRFFSAPVTPPVSTPKATNTNNESTTIITEPTKPRIINKLRESFFSINNALLSTRFKDKLDAENIILKMVRDYLSYPDKLALIFALTKTSKTNLRLFQPILQLNNLLLGVAHGKQAEVNDFLTKLSHESKAKLLLQADTFTDYSGRTFNNICAYEYAYWAKDTHMCRMLEAHMDTNTKAAMLKRIDSIDQNGLAYEQAGIMVKPTPHFDFSPLKLALHNYIIAENNAASTAEEMSAAWNKIGLAQRDLPEHVISEYCRTDRSFFPLPDFKEPKLLRYLIYNHYDRYKQAAKSFFPLDVSDPLKVNYALFGRCQGWIVTVGGSWESLKTYNKPKDIENDLAAISRLDDVRTAELAESRKNLLPLDQEHDRISTPKGKR